MDFINRRISKLSATKLLVYKNVYWALLGKVVNLLNGLLIGILVARYLGPEQYGLMNYVISFVCLFMILASFGLDDIEIRELSNTKMEKKMLIGTAFRLKLFFAIVAILLVAVFVFLFESNTFTRFLILIYSFSMIFNSFSVIRNYFTSIVLNEYVVKTEISRTILGALLKVVLLVFHASLTWFIVACVFDTVFVALGYIYSYNKKVGFIKDWVFDRNVANFFLKQSFPLLLSGTAVIIYQRIDQVMIGDMIDKTSVGYFSVAGRFSELILFLPMIMAQTLTPLLIRVRERDINEYNVKKQQFVNIVVWISILLSIAVSLSSYWLVSLTFGRQYLAAVPVLQLLAYKTVGMALSVSAGQLIIIENIQKYAFIRNIIGCIVCVILNLILIPYWGIMGSTLSTVITTIFIGSVANLFIGSYHQILKIQLKSIFLGWKDLIHIRQLL